MGQIKGEGGAEAGAAQLVMAGNKRGPAAAAEGGLDGADGRPAGRAEEGEVPPGEPPAASQTGGGKNEFLAGGPERSQPSLHFLLTGPERVHDGIEGRAGPQGAARFFRVGPVV